MKKRPLAETTSFYQSHLDRVSRSFAFCIEELQQPLRNEIALSYILCRLVDTIEDSIWPTPQAQQNSFLKFIELIQKPLTTDSLALEDIAHWANDFPNSIPQSEKVLLTDAAQFFYDLHQLEDTKKKIIQKSVINMTRGMMFFCNRNSSLQINSLTENHQYCFFVAGVVGELLTEVFATHCENFVADSTTYKGAIHFGLFLQKINLLKDQQGDLIEGRQLIHQRNETRRSLALHIQPALNYILKIPSERKDYRVFCAWSFFLGLSSLPYIDRSWEKQKPLKISRTEAFFILTQVKSNITDDEWLRQKSSELCQKALIDADQIESLNLNFSYSSLPLENLYHGHLTPTDFEDLKISIKPTEKPNASREAEHTL